MYSRKSGTFALLYAKINVKSNYFLFLTSLESPLNKGGSEGVWKYRWLQTKEYFEKVMQDFNQNRRGRNLRKYCSDEGIDYKWLSEYKKQYSSSKGKVEKEEEPSLIPLQVIDERFSEQPVVQPEAKWCVKQLVIASPTGDELEIKCSNLAVVVELLRKMSM